MLQVPRNISKNPKSALGTLFGQFRNSGTATPPCSSDNAATGGGSLPRIGCFRPVSYQSLRENTLKGLGWPKKVKKPKFTSGGVLQCGGSASSPSLLGVLLWSICRERNDDYNGEKITRNGNQERPRQRRFLSFPAAVPLDFTRSFRFICPFFCSDLVMGVFKIEFRVNKNFYLFWQLEVASAWR